MDCREAREVLLSSTNSGEPTTEEKQAYEHLTVCPICRTALNQLMAEITQWTKICAAVQEMLPIYITDELMAAPVQVRYPYIAQHLAECPRCAHIHDELRGLCQGVYPEGNPKPPPDPTPDLSFLQGRSK